MLIGNVACIDIMYTYYTILNRITISIKIDSYIYSEHTHYYAQLKINIAQSLCLLARESQYGIMPVRLFLFISVVLLTLFKNIFITQTRTRSRYTNPSYFYSKHGTYSSTPTPRSIIYFAFL